MLNVRKATSEDRVPQINKAPEILKYTVSQNDAVSLEFAIKYDVRMNSRILATRVRDKQPPNW